MITRSIARRAPLALLALVGAAACGGAPASPQAPASSAAPVASVALPPPPDLSPVAPPPGLVVSGTIPKVGASLATVHGWTQLPMPQSEQLTELVAGEALGAIVDLDRPIDFAVAVSGEGQNLTGYVAVAAGVRDLDTVRSALGDRYKLVPGENGSYAIQRASATQDQGGEGEEHTCAIAPAYGPAALRLVCGLDGKALATLTPWLTRGATHQSAAADTHVEVRMQALKPTITDERRLLSVLLGGIMGGHAGLSGLRDFAVAAANDVADFGMDLDTLSLDVALSDPGASMTATVKLGSSTSMMARAMTGNADRNGPPPASFWQMPADADFALFTRGFDPKDLARGRDLALKVLDDKLAEDGVKPTDRHSVVDAIAAFVTPASAAYASGVDIDALRKALAAEKALPDAADLVARREAARASAQAVLGWRILETDEPAATRLDAFKMFTSAWGRAAAAYKAKGERSIAVRAAPLPKGVTLPKEAQRFVLDVPLEDPIAPEAPKGKPKPGPAKPMVVDVFIVPDGARTWIGAGGDPGLVAAKLQVAVSGTGDNLRGRSELASLRDATLGSAGFVTERALPEVGQMIQAFSGDADIAGGADIFDEIAQLPHQGMAAIPFTHTPSANPAGTVVGTLQIPRATVDDVLVSILKHGI